MAVDPILPRRPNGMFARIKLVGGPFDGEDAGWLPPDCGGPVQIVWAGWMPWGLDAWLYEWHGETTKKLGYTEFLLFRATGRRLAAAEIPPLIADSADLWAAAAVLMQEIQ
jgi:hypothetical protein